MIRILLVSFFAIVYAISFAQVGVGTETPDTTAILEVSSTEKGILFPRMATSQREAITSPATGLHVYDTETKSLWFYNGGSWVDYATQGTYGDIKSGIQSTDHGGWIKLDGRALDLLTTSQKAVATSLGFSGYLPNAAEAYLSQNGTTLGSVYGSNTVTLIKANLPNTTFSGTAASAGSHSHTFTGNALGNHKHSGTTSSGGSHNHSVNALKSGTGDSGIVGNNNADPGSANGSTSSAGSHTHNFETNNASAGTPSGTISSDGAHTHTVTVSSGGSGTPVIIIPKSLSVNMFIYLGK